MPRLHAQVAAALLLSVVPVVAVAAAPEPTLGQIENAHGKAAYLEKDAVAAEFLVEGFGGLELEGTMLFTPSLAQVRMTLADGTVLIYDDGAAWMVEGSAAPPPPMARFHVLTWPYFLAVPFKLRDPGTYHEDVGSRPVTGPDDTTVAVKMTFGDGVGDAPDDWYILLPNNDGVLAAMAYIVTYGTPVEEASKTPSIIVYDDFRTIDGVTLPLDWSFHYWTVDGGIADGEPKGRATIRSVKFVTPDGDAFDPPAGATPLPAP